MSLWMLAGRWLEMVLRVARCSDGRPTRSRKLKLQAALFFAQVAWRLTASFRRTCPAVTTDD